MVNKKKLLKILGEILIGIFIFVTGYFIVSYFTSDSPILYSSGCDSSISKPVGTYNFELRNSGKSGASISACFYPKNMYFINNSSKSCTSQEIYPRTSDLETPTLLFKSKIFVNQSNTEFGGNFSVDIVVDCKQKIWDIFPKSCKPLNYNCNYHNIGYSLQLVTDSI